ncbi:MAG: phosphodiester glycosidase family protein [Leptolyngbyaceae bacterium]|nr:phosphodiester glycosidase family protein [Leptolyngbyaceae bacterium]
MSLRFLPTTILMLPLAVPLGFYVVGQYHRPPRQEIAYPLFHGIDYQRHVETSPHPYVIHQITIDLTAAGVQPFVTPPSPQGELPDVTIGESGGLNRPETAVLAQTTGDFLQRFELQLAINANYFYEFEEKTPWWVYPRKGNEVYALGEAIAPNPQNPEGPAMHYGVPRQNWPALCFAADHRARIEPSGTCPNETRHGIAGRDLLVDHGKALTQFPNQRGDKPYARAAVGLDATGQQLQIAVIDGKQPHYSEVLLLVDLAQWFEQLAVDRAIALDGGGSSTVVINNGSGPTLLNAPIQAKWPMTQRPIANHLGFYALPVTP